ncbi:DUF6232 family protein [Kitasatospora cineracea]|uniref:Uncharacterized protein n=1 Tax=Kitasatospora cineracea TaxID=88074 RepID=A0A8G1XBI2_9ACTN|nr:DUF6232 family protein [Kitasatospora cineracea]ROR44300.1 hypothetical protein EDD39_2487 [Kitasatospora cineracea]
MPPRPAFRPGQVEVRIDGRTLWIAGAAYPLRNIARVYQVVLHPRSAEAFGRFGRRFAGTLAVLIVVLSVGLMSISASSSYRDERDQNRTSFSQFVVTVGVVLLVLYVVDLLRVVLQKVRHVVAVETNGSSVALITAPDEAGRRAITQYLAAAIDRPEAGLLLHVDTLSVNPAHYYFGDTVNVHGTGNIGRISG